MRKRQMSKIVDEAFILFAFPQLNNLLQYLFNKNHYFNQKYFSLQ